MVFSSAIFLFGFLPLLLGLYYIIPKKYRNYLLLLFSLIFYYFGGPAYILLILALVLCDYFFALGINKYKDKRKLLLLLCLLVNIGLLFYYKYWNFFFDSVNFIFSSNIKVRQVVLPIGISFFTFQALSYVIDVYRKEVKVQKNPLQLLLYVSFFPQLVAGPIVRYKDVEKEIVSRKETFDDFVQGLERFILGFAKKMIIANQLGLLADIVFETKSLSTPVAYLGAIAYMFQIYYDFSAYSDMAIGLGRMFGFHFLENFDYPYISKSITEFWKRWHISLSTWFRDYVYIPLGGNRKGIKRQIINLLIVWLCTGLWHGASWNFVLWGLYYFVFLVLEKFVLKKALDKIPNILRHIFTLLIVLIGWILFRADNLMVFGRFIKVMFVPTWTKINISEFIIYIQTYYIYFILAIIFSMPIYRRIVTKIDSIKNERAKVFWGLCRYAFLIVVFVIAIMFLAQASYNPFIYFRF